MDNQNMTFEQNTDAANDTVENTNQSSIPATVNTNGKIIPAQFAALNSKKALIFIGAVVLAVIIICVLVSNAVTNKRISDVEDSIFALSSNVYECEDMIMETYENYDKLSDKAKREVQNRSELIELYKQLEVIIESRKSAAAKVDALIDAIDYSNIYAQASTVKVASAGYFNLDEKAVKYLKNENKLEKAYGDVSNLYIEITSENFFDLFSVEFSVMEHANFGSGISIEQDGYDIEWDDDDGRITPNYDINAHNDYATPVYIYVVPKYPNLSSSCYFNINLHQTYNGLGIIDSDIHEFEIQQGNISYDSSMGIGEYLILVQNNDAGSGILDLFGFSYDFSDMFHEMNPFDASRVEISNVSGAVAY